MAKKGNNKVVEPKEQRTAVVKGGNITDSVMSRVQTLEKSGGIQFPPNYSYANALKSAWLVLQNVADKSGKPALSVCTKESVTNSLFDMVIQGLSPAKKQCYFIVYGSQLQLQRSYFGTVAVTKRLEAIKDAIARVIYQGDIFEYHFDTRTMRTVIDKHEQKFEDINPDKIVGAYAIVTMSDGTFDVSDPMTFEQIKRAWKQGPMKGESPAHKNFPDEMSKKTVLNRKCKMYFNTSDDSDLLIEAINRTTANEYDDVEYEEVVQNNIDEKANKGELLDIKTSSSDNGNSGTEEHTQPESSEEKETNWENPISVIAAIENIQNVDEYNDFKKENKRRLEQFTGKDADSIKSAMNAKADQVLKAEDEGKN